MALSWRRRRRIGIALSGGGARGLAHLGVLEILEAAGIVPHAVAGTSAGALFGALAAAGVPLHTIVDVAADTGWTRLARPVLPGQGGLFSLAPLEKVLAQVLGGRKRFEDLPRQFLCVATDIENDAPVLLSSGDLASAVRASCSVPGVFVPVEREGRLLVDGGIMVNLPVQCLLDAGCDYVIAVDVLPGRLTPARPKGVLEVMLVTFYNVVRHASREADLANVVVTPDVRRFGFVDFEQRERLLDAGRDAARAVVDQIRTDLGLAPRPSLAARALAVVHDVRAAVARAVSALRRRALRDHRDDVPRLTTGTRLSSAPIADDVDAAQ